MTQQLSAAGPDAYVIAIKRKRSVNNVDRSGKPLLFFIIGQAVADHGLDQPVDGELLLAPLDQRIAQQRADCLVEGQRIGGCGGQGRGHQFRVFGQHVLGNVVRRKKGTEIEQRDGGRRFLGYFLERQIPSRSHGVGIIGRFTALQHVGPALAKEFQIIGQRNLVFVCIGGGLCQC